MNKSDLIDNRYKKIRTLGEGGMGTVFLVEDIARNNRVFAAKTVKSAFIAKDAENSLLRFKTEYDIMTRLKHPNLARVYDFGQDINGDYYILMEFVEGITLRQLLKEKHKLSVDDAVSIIIPLLQALEFIHSRNIIYRDLKPDNILIEIENNRIKAVKLLDFGLADLGRAEKKSKGTIHYMAPEVVAKQSIDSRADIFSLGVLFYEMLTGNFIYADESIKSVLDSLLDENTFVATADLRLNEIDPPLLKPLIAKMTAYQKDSRYICCSEVIDNLNHLLHKKYALETTETEQAYILGVDFVGRSAEFKIMVDACSNSSNALTVISGSEGIGKSRLIEEFGKYCNLHDILFFSGSSSNSLAYEPFLEILNKLLYSFKKSALPKLSGFLKLFLPNHPALKKFTSPTNSDPQAVKGVLIQLIAEIIVKYSLQQSRKTVLILHNLHNIDENSLEIIGTILSKLRELKQTNNLLLVAEYRVDKNQQAIEFFENFTERDSIHIVELKPLNAQEIESYIINMFGEKRVHHTIKENTNRIRDMVGGNPLFLQELLKMLVENQLIIRTSLFWVLQKSLDQIKVPDNVKDIIRQRLNKIEFTPLEMRACKLLSLMLKSSVNVEMLQKIADQELTLDWNKFLNFLVENELMIEKDQEFYPVSNLICEVIRENIPEADAWTIHRYMVKKLEDIYRIDTNDLDKLTDFELDEITYHVFHSSYQIESEITGKTLFYLLASIKRSFLRFSYKKALKFCSLVSEIDKKYNFSNTDFKKLIIEASGFKGKIYLSTNKLEDALKTLTKVVKKYKESAYINEIAPIYSRLAYVCLRMSNYEDALSYNQLAKNSYEELKDTEGLAGCSTTIALVDYYQGNYQNSLISYQKSLEYIKLTDNQDMLGRCYNNIGNIYWILSDYDKAMKYYMRQLKISEDLNNIDSIGRVAGNIGIVYNQLEEHAKALYYFKKALENSERVGDKYNLGNTYGNMGVLYHGTGDDKKAILCFEKAYKIKSDAKDFYGMMIGCTNFGDAYDKLHDYEKAEFYYSESIRLAEKTNAAFFLSEYNIKKAFFFFERQRYQEAAVILDTISKSIHEQSLYFFKTVNTMVSFFVSDKSLIERSQEFINSMHELLEDPQRTTPDDHAEIYYYLWEILSKNCQEKQFAAEISQARESALKIYKELAAKSKYAINHERLAVLSKYN